jgi:hypothetical protein
VNTSWTAVLAAVLAILGVAWAIISVFARIDPSASIAVACASVAFAVLSLRERM